MNDYERVEMKQYEVIINSIIHYVNALSLAHALRKASDLRLEDKDIVTIRVEQ